jgi:hypothetical protein
MLSVFTTPQQHITVIYQHREETYPPHPRHPDIPHPCLWIMASWITMVMRMDMATDMDMVEAREAKDPRAVDILPMVALVSQASRIPRHRIILLPRRVPRVDMEEMAKEGTVVIMTATAVTTRRAPRMVDMMDITDHPRGRRTVVTVMVGTVVMMTATAVTTRRAPRMMVADVTNHPRGRRMAVTAMEGTVVMMAATAITRRAPRMMVADVTNHPRGRRMVVTAMVDTVVIMAATMVTTRRAPRMVVADITNHPRGPRTAVTVTEGMDTVVMMAAMVVTRRAPRTVAAVTEGTMTRWNLHPDMMMDMTPRDRRMVDTVAATEGTVTVMVDTELYELLPFKPRERRSSPPLPLLHHLVSLSV